MVGQVPDILVDVDKTVELAFHEFPHLIQGHQAVLRPEKGNPHDVHDRDLRRLVPVFHDKTDDPLPGLHLAVLQGRPLEGHEPVLFRFRRGLLALFRVYEFKFERVVILDVQILDDALDPRGQFGEPLDAHVGRHAVQG